MQATTIGETSEYVTSAVETRGLVCFSYMGLEGIGKLSMSNIICQAPCRLHSSLLCTSDGHINADSEAAQIDRVNKHARCSW